MFFAPIIILTAAQVAASKAAAAQAEARAKLGLPPAPPSTLHEIPASKWGEGDWLMLIWLILGGVVFCAPWIALIYAVVKIAFKVNGIPFP